METNNLGKTIWPEPYACNNSRTELYSPRNASRYKTYGENMHYGH